MFVILLIICSVFMIDSNIYSNTNTDYIIRISELEFSTEEFLDNKLSQAAKMGIFYLEIPKECKHLIKEGSAFAGSFYNKASIKELNLDGFSGYHDRNLSQVEALYLERGYWRKFLPEELFTLALKTHYLAVEVLKKTLSACKIPKDEHEKISGMVTSGAGDVFLTLNHYRPEREYEGLAAHRDFGQITVLYVDQPGLQVKIDEKWFNVPPIEGYFIIIFGKALEKSINNPELLTAAWHRVEKIENDRVSFAVCLGNSGNSFIYQKTSDGKLINTGELYLKVLQASTRYKESTY